MPNPDLDIVIPLFKTGANLPRLIKRLNEWCATVSIKVRVVFVDDGSPDDTFGRLQEELQNARFEHKAIRLAMNYGQYTTTVVGISHTSAPLVATLDDDLQHDIFQLDILLAEMETQKADLVYGSYKERRHSIFRKVGTGCLKLFLSRDGIDYSGVSSFRLMKSSVAAVFKNIQAPVVFVDEYLMKYARKKIACEVKHQERAEGKSNYSYYKLAKLSIDILLFYSSFPLKMITRFGLLMAMVFFMLGCFYIWQKTFNDIQLGFTSIIVAIFFSTGMIMLSLGIIGEYIRRIWVSQNGLDRIVIAEEIG